MRRKRHGLAASRSQTILSRCSARLRYFSSSACVPSILMRAGVHGEKSLMKSLSWPTTFILFGMTSVFASDNPSDRGDRPVENAVLPDVIVTATRTARTADETLAPVTVITREDVERLQLRSVQDALRNVSGLSIANNGGPGKTTSVFLRGTESDHVLVLIDGIKIGSATSGSAAFQDIPIDQIERIEVVRGPRSSLYGSEALGGVIQLFTRKGGGKLTPSFSVGGGSDKTLQGNIGISGGGEHGWFSANLSGFDTNSFNACSGRPFPSGGGCFTNEPDDDGYRNVSGALRAGYRFANGTELDVNWLRTEGDNEFDGSFVNESDFMQQVFGANARFSPLANWQISLRVGRSYDKSKNFKDGNFRTRFDTKRDILSLQNDILITADQLLTVGADYQDDQIDSNNNFAETDRANKAVFGQYQGEFNAHNWQLSVRYDDNEQFGGKTTGNVTWGYAFNNELRFTAAYGTAFKAPTFNELYFPGFGNPELEPETSQSWEIGLSGVMPVGRWAINAFWTEVDDLIAFDAATFAPANVDSARIRGLEAEITTRLLEWDISANLTLLDPENRSDGANNGNTLPRRATESFNLRADRAFGRWRVGTTINAVGKRYDDLANNRELGAYTTVDLRGEYSVAKNWLLQAQIVNLFDKDYETAAFYNQPGRGFFFTVRYQP